MEPTVKGTKTAPSIEEPRDGSALLHSGPEDQSLSLLEKVGEVLRTSTEVNELLYRVATLIGENFNAQRCLFNEIDLDNDVEIVHRDYANGIDSVAGRHPISVYSSITSAEMVSGKTVVNDDSSIDSRTADLYFDVYKPAGERSYVAVPLMRTGKWVSSLWISCDRPARWAASDVALLELIAERSWLTVERLRNEEALRESEQKYRSLFESIDDGFCLIEMVFDELGNSIDCKILETNAAYKKLSPIEPGQTVREVFPDIDQELFDIYGEVVRSGKPQHLERFNKSLGTWFSTRVSRVGSAGNKQLAVVFSDVTERRRTQEELKRSEELFASFMKHLPGLAWIKDIDGRYLFVNDAAEAAFAKSRESIYGRGDEDIFPPQTAAVFRENDMSVLDEKIGIQTVESLEQGEGRLHHSLVSKFPILDQDGEPTMIAGMAIDITEQRKAEMALRESEEQFRLITDAMPALISYVDSSERFHFANQTYSHWFGIEPGDVVGQRVQDVFGQKAYAIVKKGIDQALAGELARFETEIEYRDGVTRFVHVSYTPDISGDGTIRGYFGLTADMTDLKRSQDLLRKTAEELQRAHDQLELRVAERTRELAESNEALLREAEARITGEEQRIYLLRRLVTGQEIERRRIARDIHDQLGQRLTGLRLKLESLRGLVEGSSEIADRVDRLQEIGAKLDSEVSFLAWELRPSVLDDLGLVEALRAFVKEWSRHFEVEADFQTLRLGQDRFDPEIETHLYRITQEALNNVSKYANARNVTVVLERRDRELLLIIEDNGIGFDADQKRVPSEAGRGLGLIGMKERASLIGGELEIESNPSGTTVYARIPAYD